ncbi:hypothetical protein N7462_000442 [Penicillium macrosclerotiorum]|uniref:uncharacterized protein n=1 Tax=Penicillium macrosclerotiorum TaxID=303699 RepID=UPI002549BCDE|nr:uncharacterized protein N7462_000442 [Penicillium macrosclerotiorum]KAJ5698437.1 hypothetical protein N7462_000442 [Penicillium macrosclerotiorum]
MDTCRGLELDFSAMIQLSAVEYPITVNSGLVLMGYSTALVPIRITTDDKVLWHLETTKDDSQIKVSKLKSIKRKWLRVFELDLLQSRKALLGWCQEANILLGTDELPPNVAWSDSEVKRVSWHWKGANVQLLVQSAAPIQVGGQLGMAFDRTINTVKNDPSRNYLKCLKGSMMEQVLIYDVSAGRAWLVPLLCVFHHMMLVYSKTLGDSLSVAPRAIPASDSASASYRVLEGQGDTVLDGSGRDKLTVRDLILGFSVNLSRIDVQPSRGATIFGYEFMDIVMESPRIELKKQQITKDGLMWASLLSEVNCLFCAGLGDAIVGKRSPDILSPCNRIPEGSDLMAVSMYSIEKLSQKHGGPLLDFIQRLSHTHYWRLKGRPFQPCQHKDERDSCWTHPAFLQEIHTRRPSAVPGERCEETCPGGALVFGGPQKSKLHFQMPILNRQPIRLSKKKTVSVVCVDTDCEAAR